MTRYRRNWDTVDLEVLWSRASKTVSHEGADLELDALTNRKPVKGVSDERRDMGELWDAPDETGRSIENRWKFRCSGMAALLCLINCRNYYYYYYYYYYNNNNNTIIALYVTI